MQNKLVLACAACHSRNYSTVKSKAQSSERLEIKKFCKVCNAHTVHRETK